MSESPDLLPLRSPEEGGLAFELVRRGYDRDQVENHLGWLEDQLRNAEAARDAAEQAAATAAADAESAREELELGRPLWHEFGDRITQILTLAEEEGTHIRHQRSREADALLAEAQQSSIDTERACTEQARESQAQAEHLVSTAEAQAEHFVSTAQAQAEQIMTTAHSQSEQIMTSAQAEADRILARTQQQAAEEERASSRRLAELERQRDAVSAQLSRMQEALTQALAPMNAAQNLQPASEPTAGVQLSDDSEYLTDYPAGDEYPTEAYVAGTPAVKSSSRVSGNGRGRS